MVVYQGAAEGKKEPGQRHGDCGRHTKSLHLAKYSMRLQDARGTTGDNGN